VAWVGRGEVVGVVFALHLNTVTLDGFGQPAGLAVNHSAAAQLSTTCFAQVAGGELNKSWKAS